eukprot:7379558-Prymnesium_polylepis.1
MHVDATDGGAEDATWRRTSRTYRAASVNACCTTPLTNPLAKERASRLSFRASVSARRTAAFVIAASLRLRRAASFSASAAAVYASRHSEAIEARTNAQASAATRFAAAAAADRHSACRCSSAHSASSCCSHAAFSAVRPGDDLHSPLVSVERSAAAGPAAGLGCNRGACSTKARALPPRAEAAAARAASFSVSVGSSSPSESTLTGVSGRLPCPPRMASAPRLQAVSSC